MNRWQSDVRQFHREVLDGPTSPAEPRVRNPELRARLILEEAIETAVALLGGPRAAEVARQMLVDAIRDPGFLDKEPDLAETVDGVVDLIYVALGTAEDVGVDLDPFWDEVHRANMAKRDPTGAQKANTSPVGKVLKPEGWRPPDIAGVLGRARLDWLVAEVRAAVERGDSPREPSREQRISWAYGNVALSNPNVTREMVEAALDRLDAERIVFDDRTCLDGTKTEFTNPHAHCPVVAIVEGRPRVCTCECKTCKRAWFADGKPCVRDGRVVRE